MKGSEILTSTLARLNVKHIFGIPGDVPYVFEALSRSSIQFIPTRHEQVAGFMADVYGRFGDVPGVCYGSLGPGATNLVTAIANSYQDRSPMVVLVDQVSSSDFHADFHQYIPFERLLEPITKKAILIQKAQDIDFTLEYAFELAKEERPGPVALILPEDVLTQEVGELQFRKRASHKRLQSKRSIHEDQISEVERAIRESKFGVVIAGEGLTRAQAEKEFTAFVERFNLPVFTTFMAKGALSEQHPLSLGTISRHFESVFEPLFEEADLVITIGYDYIEGIRPSFWEKGKDATVICIDSIPNSVPEFYYPDLEVVTNIKSCLERLSETELQKQEINFNLDEFRKAKDNSFRGQSAENKSICAYIDVLSEKLSDTDILISDVGMHKQFVGLTYVARKPNTVVFSNGLSSMGFSLGAAMSTKLLHPEKTVVAVCGDGGFLMNVQDLETCKRLNLPIIIVLFDDNSYGLIRWRQEKTFQNNMAVKLSNPDFLALAHSFGFDASQAATPEEFALALAKATTSQNPTVIHVPITYNYKQA